MTPRWSKATTCSRSSLLITVVLKRWQETSRLTTILIVFTSPDWLRIHLRMGEARYVQPCLWLQKWCSSAQGLCCWDVRCATHLNNPGSQFSNIDEFDDFYLGNVVDNNYAVQIIHSFVANAICRYARSRWEILSPMIDDITCIVVKIHRWVLWVASIFNIYMHKYQYIYSWVCKLNLWYFY